MFLLCPSMVSSFAGSLTPSFEEALTRCLGPGCGADIAFTDDRIRSRYSTTSILKLNFRCGSGI